MRLQGTSDPAALGRYGHVRPAPFWRKRCGRPCPGTSRSCTREPQHRGPHVAHDLLRRAVAVWEGKEAPAARPQARKAVAKKPVGLRSGGSTSLSQRLGSAAKFVDDHVEEIALAVFFVAFVWFALDWLLIIMR